MGDGRFKWPTGAMALVFLLAQACGIAAASEPGGSANANGASAATGMSANQFGTATPTITAHKCNCVNSALGECNGNATAIAARRQDFGGGFGDSATGTETVARATAANGMKQAQAYIDNALPAQNAAALNPIDAHTAVNGSETAPATTHGNPAITTSGVAWRLPRGCAVADATFPDGGRATGNYRASSEHYARPFGPATSGAHTGLTVNPDAPTNTGTGLNFGEGDTASSTTASSVPTAA